MAKASKIELNGKVYDLHSSPIEPAHHQNKPKSVTTGSGVVDGFRRRRTQAHAPVTAAPKKTQRSKTLMRSVVKKPVASHSSKPSVVKPQAVNPRRVERASKVSKSHLISRFGNAHDRSFAPQIAPLPVQPEPADFPDTPIIPHHDAVSISAPRQAEHHTRQARPFEHALSHANSHKQEHHKRKPLSHRTAHRLRTSPRVIKTATTLLATLMIGGFFMYQNIPNLAMKVAAARAGINARLPGYAPAGFSLGEHIQYSPGKIMLSYQSNSDDREFKLTQTTTDLTPETLLSEEVAAKHVSYQTYQEADKTIYIDEDNNATWIDDGVRYQIESNAALSSDQLLRIAKSL